MKVSLKSNLILNKLRITFNSIKDKISGDKNMDFFRTALNEGKVSKKYVLCIWVCFLLFNG
jgi:hypothetical protein